MSIIKIIYNVIHTESDFPVPVGLSRITTFFLSSIALYLIKY